MRHLLTIEALFDVIVIVNEGLAQLVAHKVAQPVNKMTKVIFLQQNATTHIEKTDNCEISHHDEVF